MLSTSAVPMDHTCDLLLPKCDRDADEVSEVYKLYDIIPKEVLKLYYDLASQAMEQGFEEQDDFLTDMLNKIENSTKAKKKVAVLLVMKSIALWLGLKANTCSRIGLVTEVCYGFTEVAKYIINNFTMQGPGGRLLFS